MKILFLEESNYQSFAKNPLTIGGLVVKKEDIKKIADDIKAIKMKHNIKPLTEVKWTKIGKSKIDAYEELVKYAINNENIQIRILLAKDKKNIRISYSDWYSRLHYSLINKSPFTIKGVISDKKGNGFEKKLNDTIEISIFGSPLKEYVNSKDSQITQLSDIFLGAASAINGIVIESPYKKYIADLIQKKIDLKITTPLSSSQNKYSIFHWRNN